ncbi:hypothetical protein KDA82_40885, partial [Streptomyces daliensis]|nr:hypothetical protein [Streptomyces daliensis]
QWVSVEKTAAYFQEHHGAPLDRAYQAALSEAIEEVTAELLMDPSNSTCAMTRARENVSRRAQRTFLRNAHDLTKAAKAAA